VFALKQIGLRSFGSAFASTLRGHAVYTIRNMNSSTFSTLTPATDAQNETLPFFTAQQAEDVLGWTEESFKSCRKPFAHQGAATRKARHATQNKAQPAKLITTNWHI